MASHTASSVDASELSRKTLRTQVDQLLATSRFEIANNLRKAMTKDYNRLKEIRDSATAEYLQTSSVNTLADKRSEISSLYSDFSTKCQSIDTDDLEDQEKHELITEKVDAEAISINVDKFIANELDARAKAEIPPLVATPSVDTGASSKHDDQISALQKQLQSLILQAQREKNAADDRIKSLESKFGNAQNQMDDSLVGDSNEQTNEPEVEQVSPLVTIVNQGMKAGQD